MTTNTQRTRMTALGTHVRTMRTFLHLTQEQLAKDAGVSQGAVSRLESGTGLATPYLVVLRVQHVLCAKLRAMDQDIALGDELTALLSHPSMLPDQDAPASVPARPITADPLLAPYLATFHRVSPRAREHLLTVVNAVAEVISPAPARAEA